MLTKYTTKQVLSKRLEKLTKHYEALSKYKQSIDTMSSAKDIYSPSIFDALRVEEMAVLEAYLKRFSSIQDFLGAKIFPLLTTLIGMGECKMSEVLYVMEKEKIIDTFANWLELREIRNELEHDYPDAIEGALEDLKFCVEHFFRLEKYYVNTLKFTEKYLQ